MRAAIAPSSLSLSLEPPDWFSNVSRIFHPRCKFGLVCEAALRRCMHVSDKAIDPRSPSNPSNQSYILLFLLPSLEWQKKVGIPGAMSSALSSDPKAVQFRGSLDLQAVCGFLSTMMMECRKRRKEKMVSFCNHSDINADTRNCRKPDLVQMMTLGLV